MSEKKLALDPQETSKLNTPAPAVNVSLNSEARGLYEPVHGSAPDIAGQGKANPLATILSAAMLLRYSLNEDAAAKAIENAVELVLDSGLRTGDIAAPGEVACSTSDMGDAVVAALRAA